MKNGLVGRSSLSMMIVVRIVVDPISSEVSEEGKPPDKITQNKKFIRTSFF